MSEGPEAKDDYIRGAW